MDRLHVAPLETRDPAVVDPPAPDGRMTGPGDRLGIAANREPGPSDEGSRR
jgi:hypothetical protein